ncbi:FtsX-like permease family protein, partial [candidate division KSB1 bacterium]
YLKPLLDFRHDSRHIDSIIFGSNSAVLYFFFIIGFLLLLIVCFNYINLTTARLNNRFKEIGIRKVTGAFRRQLVMQFLGESIVITFIALPVSIILNEMIVLPYFLNMLGVDFPFSLFDQPQLIPWLTTLVIFVGLISGLYPAIAFSRPDPSSILSKNNAVALKGSILRKFLVISQFSVSFLFIVFTIGVGDQFEYMMNVDIGYNRDNLAIVSINDEIRSKLEPFKESLLRHSDIKSVTSAGNTAYYWMTENTVIPEGRSKNEAWTMNTYAVDYGFIEIVELEVIQGRSFSVQFNDTENFIINEKAAEQLKWRDPIGRQLVFNGKKGTIVGVVKDFLFKDMIYDILPTVLYIAPEESRYLYIKLADTADPQVLEYIKNQWNEHAESMPFVYYMLNDAFEEQHIDVQDIGNTMGLIGAMGIFFSYVGMFGLASFNVGKRKKEIGIRKALGASVKGIIKLLINEYLVLALISICVSIPGVYFLLNNFIQGNWTYSRSIRMEVVILTSIFTVTVVFVSVIYQTLRTAYSNPVDSLRYE